MKRKVFSGARRAQVERQAEDWLAKQAPSFELHAAMTRLRGRASGVTVTIWYDLHTKVGARHIQSRLAA
jgi:hypothetical protein